MADRVAKTAMDSKPRLAPGVRLQFDKTREAWLLMAPERVIEMEGPAVEILKRCDGNRTVDQIVDELAAIFAADRSEIAADVADMVDDLADKHLLGAPR